MNQKPVVFVNRFFFPDHSATSQILSDLAFALAKQGRSVRVISSRLRYDDSSARLPKQEWINGVLVDRIWSTGFGRKNLLARALDYLTFYISVCCALLRIITPETTVVAKTDPPLLSLFVRPVVRLRRATLVNWLQDIFPEVAGALGLPIVGGPVLKLLRTARNSTLRSAASNVVLGGRMRAFLLTQGVPEERVVIVPNWADGSQIRPIDPGLSIFRQEWGLVGRFVVGYSGNLGRAHEFATIIEAAQALEQDTRIVFLFIGAGAQRDLVEAEVRRRGLLNVFFKPYQHRNDLSESLGVANVHLVSLHPSLEGFIVPSKFYGVAAAARPTLFIGDPLGEIAIVLRETASGYTIPPGSAVDLTKAILTLAGDSELCARLGKNARDAFETRFEREIAVRAWSSLLDSVAR